MTNHGDRAAWYVQGRDRRFVTLADSGEVGTTSCPHAATLWTSADAANELCDQLNRDFGEAHFGVFPTGTHNPNVRVGRG